MYISAPSRACCSSKASTLMQAITIFRKTGSSSRIGETSFASLHIWGHAWRWCGEAEQEHSASACLYHAAGRAFRSRIWLEGGVVSTTPPTEASIPIRGNSHPIGHYSPLHVLLPMLHQEQNPVFLCSSCRSGPLNYTLRTSVQPLLSLSWRLRLRECDMEGIGSG